jgi:hypothetical protein
MDEWRQALRKTNGNFGNFMEEYKKRRGIKQMVYNDGCGICLKQKKAKGMYRKIEIVEEDESNTLRVETTDLINFLGMFGPALICYGRLQNKAFSLPAIPTGFKWEIVQGKNLFCLVAVKNDK